MLPRAGSESGRAVKLDKLAKQLRRDVAANPKKAIALGVMALVALYFWAPLVWRWVSPEGGKKSKALAALILTDDPEEPSHAAKRRAAGKFRWEKVRPLIAQDARMSPARFDLQWTDPFAATFWPAGDASATNPAAQAKPEAAVLDFNPHEAGVVLSSVMIGNKRRTATINGRSYQVGESIKLAKEGTLGAVEYRLTRITVRGVELEHRGKKHILLLAPAELAEGDFIGHASPRQDD